MYPGQPCPGCGQGCPGYTLTHQLNLDKAVVTYVKKNDVMRKAWGEVDWEVGDDVR